MSKTQKIIYAVNDQKTSIVVVKDNDKVSDILRKIQVKENDPEYQHLFLYEKEIDPNDYFEDHYDQRAVYIATKESKIPPELKNSLSDSDDEPLSAKKEPFKPNRKVISSSDSEDESLSAKKKSSKLVKNKISNIPEPKDVIKSMSKTRKISYAVNDQKTSIVVVKDNDKVSDILRKIQVKENDPEYQHLFLYEKEIDPDDYFEDHYDQGAVYIATKESKIPPELKTFSDDDFKDDEKFSNSDDSEDERLSAKQSPSKKVIKIVVIGNSRVGKTSLLCRYFDNFFDNLQKSTVKAKHYSTYIRVKGEIFELQVWDTAGIEHPWSNLPTYTKDAHGAILLFDLTQSNSFENLYHMYSCHSNFPPNMKFVVVGTKFDLNDKRKYNSSIGLNFAQQIGTGYVEISSKKSINIDLPFNILLSQILNVPIFSLFKFESTQDLKQELKKDGPISEEFTKNELIRQSQKQLEIINKLKEENKKQSSEFEEKEKIYIQRINELDSNLNKEKAQRKNDMKIFQEKKKQYIQKISEITKNQENERNHFLNKIKELEQQQPKKNTISQKKMLQIIEISEIDKMKKVTKIGKVATSEVFIVSIEEKIALKVLEVYEDEIHGLKQFMLEYEILNNLNHPNIIKTFGICFGDEDHPISILLELCQSNLKNSINKLSDFELVSIVYEICEAMNYVHSSGLIHRDLKPENILLDDQNHVKLSDFGLATLIDKFDSKSMSQTHGVGTLKFMAPEMLRETGVYTEKIDVYSFGVLLYFIISRGKMPQINIIDVGNGKMAKIPSEFNDVSKKLIKKCWDATPEKRPSFQEIVQYIKDKKFKLIGNVEYNLPTIKSRILI